MSFISRIRVDANGPFDHELALRSLVIHAVEGLHRINLDTSEFSRWINLYGSPQKIVLRLDSGGVTVSTQTRDESLNTEIGRRVRHWFDLDADLAPINAHLAQDPIFTKQVDSRPGMRITRFQDPFEAVVLTVLGQQVTLTAGRLFAARLITAYSTQPPSDNNEPELRCFPSPKTLAIIPIDELRATIGLTGARARTVYEVARHFADSGDASKLPSRDDMQSIYGIGPWTLDYLAIRADTNPDSFPQKDAVLRRALAAISPGVNDARIASWSPYRSYAATRLWAQSI